ncbi:hypothetical protein M9458_003081, partial [Cirrhinus mrigala]
SPAIHWLRWAPSSLRLRLGLSLTILRLGTSLLRLRLDPPSGSSIPSAPPWSSVTPTPPRLSRSMPPHLFHLCPLDLPHHTGSSGLCLSLGLLRHLLRCCR